MDRIKTVACVGSGYWGKNLVRNFYELGALAAIWDSDTEKVSQLKQQYPDCRFPSSYAEVLRDDSIKAVAIATPAETHAAMVREALLADKDVFIEKPLCLSVPEGEELVALARDRKRVLMVSHLLSTHT